MSTEKIDERIKSLEAKLKQEKAKKSAALARQKMAENKAKRAAETRKKILAGSIALKLLENEPDSLFSARLRDEISLLTRDDDRALFNLPSLTPNVTVTTNDPFSNYIAQNAKKEQA